MEARMEEAKKNSRKRKVSNKEAIK